MQIFLKIFQVIFRLPQHEFRLTRFFGCHKKRVRRGSFLIGQLKRAKKCQKPPNWAVFDTFSSHTLTCIARISPNTVFWLPQKTCQAGDACTKYCMNIIPKNLVRRTFTLDLLCIKTSNANFSGQPQKTTYSESAL